MEIQGTRPKFSSAKVSLCHIVLDVFKCWQSFGARSVMFWLQICEESAIHLMLESIYWIKTGEIRPEVSFAKV